VQISAHDVGVCSRLTPSTPNVRGIRQILNVHPDPLTTIPAATSCASRLGLPASRYCTPTGYRSTGRSTQIPEAAALARKHPDIAIILNHTGMFVDRSAVIGWRQWRDGMRETRGS
jgi:predicted TIM-barrel fold metal-dependent hydrolase